MATNLEPQSANLRLTKLRALTNLVAKIHNEKVKQAYDGRVNRDPNQLEVDKQLRDILLIDPNDSVPEVNLKLLTFYLVGDKMPSQIEEHIAVNKKYVDTDPNRVTGRLCLQSERKYINGRQAGYIKIGIPHLDSSKTDNLRDIGYTVGDIKALYVFADGKQIKMLGSNKKDCHQFINKCLSACTDTFKLGTSEDHTYFGETPKDVTKLKLHGLLVTSKYLSDYHDPLNAINKGKIIL
jgi:hypothetical protein